MTSPENRFEWVQCYIRPTPPYFIVSASSVKTLEVKAIEFHRIFNPCRGDSERSTMLEGPDSLNPGVARLISFVLKLSSACRLLLSLPEKKINLSCSMVILGKVLCLQRYNDLYLHYNRKDNCKDTHYLKALV